MTSFSRTRSARGGNAGWAMAVAAALALSALSEARAQENAALGILNSMTDFVASQPTIRVTFDSDIEIITPQLEKLQFTNSGEAELRRPDKLRVHRFGGYADIEMVYDGATVSMLDKAGNRYATFDAPETVDELIDELQKRPGIGLPGADLLFSSAYDVLSADVLQARHIGLGVIDGVECEHLASVTSTLTGSSGSGAATSRSRARW